MRLCDITKEEPATHVVTIHLNKLGEDGKASEPPLHTMVLDAGESAAVAAKAGDLYALGQLVPPRIRKLSTAQPKRKPSTRGAAPGAVASAVKAADNG